MLKMLIYRRFYVTVTYCSAVVLSDMQGTTVQHAAHSAQALSCMYRLYYVAQTILLFYMH